MGQRAMVVRETQPTCKSIGDISFQASDSCAALPLRHTSAEGLAKVQEWFERQ